MPHSISYAKLSLLAGVEAVLRGEAAAAKEALTSARSQVSALSVDPASLTSLLSMGFSPAEAASALRATSGDVSAAAVAALDARAARADAKAAAAARRSAKRALRALGTTRSGKLLDGDALSNLENLGYDKPVAAEALKEHNNDLHRALDALLDPQRHEALQAAAVAHATKAERCAADVASLTALGFSPHKARAAVDGGARSANEAAAWLLAGGFEAQEAAKAAKALATGGGGGDGGAAADASAAVAAAPPAPPVDADMEAELVEAARGEEEEGAGAGGRGGGEGRRAAAEAAAVEAELREIGARADEWAARLASMAGAS